MLARKNGVRILFSDEELDVFKEVAKQNAMPVTTWARRVLLRETNQLNEDYRPERPVVVSQPVVVVRPQPKVRSIVSIKESVTDDYIICLEDGKKLKTLKRHLMSSFGLTPREYRVKWGLPLDYPMVAPNYAQQRREFAKARGLGLR